MASRRFRPSADGITLNLTRQEHDGLANVLVQFRELLLEGTEACLMRFQPPVHIHDSDASEEFWSMAADSLLRHRLEAIDTVEQGLQGVPLDDEAVAAWMQTLNSLRLYLGNTLEVGAATFDPLHMRDKPQQAARYMLYEWLAGMLDELVKVAARDLPRGTDD